MRPHPPSKPGRIISNIGGTTVIQCPWCRHQHDYTTPAPWACTNLPDRQVTNPTSKENRS